MERLTIYLTNEFKYCTLTCPLVIGGNKRLFSHSAKWTCTSGEGGGGGEGGAILSIVDSIKTLTFYLKKSGVKPRWLVQVCFSPKFGKVFIHILNATACLNVETNIYRGISLFRELLRVM